MSDLYCFKCSAKMSFKDKPGLREECPSCRSDVHVCKNCSFYDPNVYNECRETSADVVRERERANFCDYFLPRVGALAEKAKADQLRAAAEALFKKK